MRERRADSDRTTPQVSVAVTIQLHWRTTPQSKSCRRLCCSLGSCLPNSIDQRADICAQNVHKVDQLDCVETPLAAFHLRDEGLWPPEPRGNLGLGQTLRAPQFRKQRDQSLMARRAKGFWHERAQDIDIAPSANPKSGLSHFGFESQEQ